MTCLHETTVDQEEPSKGEQSIGMGILQALPLDI